MKIGFDNNKYLKMQSEHIRERINQFGDSSTSGGGKLFDDYHASRVLPGFAPDSKLRMLLQLARIRRRSSSSSVLRISEKQSTFRPRHYLRRRRTPSDSILYRQGTLCWARCNHPLFPGRTLRMSSNKSSNPWASGLPPLHHRRLSGQCSLIVSDEGYGK